MASPINRDWIAAEFSKGIDAERYLADHARSRAEAPPDDSLRVLYNEMAAADDRHRAAVETIAIRYGHTPVREGAGGGIVETIKGLKDRIAGTLSQAGPSQQLSEDLVAKANSIHWYVAWVEAFGVLGDADAAATLAEILREENAHRDALQQALNREVTQAATAAPAAAK